MLCLVTMLTDNGSMGQRAGVAAGRTDSADQRCTQNIVPREKWQLDHCAALDQSDLMPWNI